ncbi:MAG: hypothetical protein ACP5MX_01450 [Candidatus Micrarchaeia archaeon]
MKAQFWSFDVIFAVVIFSIAITILAFTWYNINNQLALAYGDSATIMQLQAESLADTLMSQGNPPNWYSIINTTNVNTWNDTSVGIGEGNGNGISSARLYALMSMASNNYQATKQALGIGFDYYIRINSTENSGANINIGIGSNPATGHALTVYVEKRSSILDGTPVQVTIDLWTNTSLGLE